MTTFDPNSPGNKGIPEPREGYEQRKVSPEKYKIAVSKGWNQRNDDGKTYNGFGWVLCERSMFGHSISASEEIQILQAIADEKMKNIIDNMEKPDVQDRPTDQRTHSEDDGAKKTNRSKRARTV